VLNFGWLVDLVTEFTGDPTQRLPVHSRRFAAWAELTYQDLADFVAMITGEAQAMGIEELRIGPMFTGVGQLVNDIVRLPDTDSAEASSAALYAEQGEWYRRHPELYPVPVQTGLLGPGLDPRVPLARDNHRYASRPHGIAAGTTFAEFFGAQWAALTNLVPFGLIHLRDGFTGPMIYRRIGPDGTSTPHPPDDVASWTAAVAALCRDLKRARPNALVMLYSSAIGPTADWRVGCLDTEQLVAEGSVDVWIDQTWGGAWQDWWDETWKGWTFQLAYLTHRAALIAAANQRRATPCRHYKLIQALDGWEPYDTLHDYPGKLRWAIWAFSHATAIGPTGARHVPGGSYVAMLNDRTRELVSTDDVTWLTTELDAAEDSAAHLQHTYGPVIVHDRATLESLSSTHPQENLSEWVEDYVGLLLKWAVPVLTAGTTTTIEAGDLHDGAVLQTPSAEGIHTAKRSAAAAPVLLTGRADLCGSDAVSAAGLTVAAERRIDGGYQRGYPTSPDLPARGWVFLPRHAPTHPADGANPDIRYRTADTTLLAVRDNVIYWQPPDWANPADGKLAHSQLGTVAPHIETLPRLSS
jgi:hypothetical protein